MYIHPMYTLYTPLHTPLHGRYCATHGFDAVELMPLSLAVFVTVASAAGFAFTAAGEAMRLTGAVDSLLAAFPEEGALDIIILQVMSFNMFLCCIPYNYVYSMQVESAQAITAQLQKFRLNKANCFDERDREKVTNDVSALFGSDEKFEEHLRANFLRDAEKKMGSSFFPCKCVIKEGTSWYQRRAPFSPLPSPSLLVCPPFGGSY